MNTSPRQRKIIHPDPRKNELSERLRGATQGHVLFDRGSRGRYATDASIYQIEPVGVLIPKTFGDVQTAIEICRDLRIPLLARGAGTSQCGQTVGRALVIDHSAYLNRVVEFDLEAMTVKVEPGMVLEIGRASWRERGCRYVE